MARQHRPDSAAGRTMEAAGRPNGAEMRIYRWERMEGIERDVLEWLLWSFL